MYRLRENHKGIKGNKREDRDDIVLSGKIWIWRKIGMSFIHIQGMKTK